MSAGSAGKVRHAKPAASRGDRMKTKPRLKRYAVFGGMCYYPNGGWNDFFASYRTVKQACESITQGKNRIRSGEWAHVVDLETGETKVKVHK